MINWKTTVAGLLAAVLPYLATVFPGLADIIAGAQSLALALLGYFAADRAK